MAALDISTLQGTAASFNAVSVAVRCLAQTCSVLSWQALFLTDDSDLIEAEKPRTRSANLCCCINQGRLA